MSGGWDGLLLIDKPTGPTSHDVVSRVRRLTGERRVGHAGTLDPLASGLLPLVLGRATRLVRYLPHSPKSYRGILRLGITTVSDDCTGDVLTEHGGRLPSPELVVSAAGGFLGDQLQSPPAVSARKVGGRRLYRLAREGVLATADARPIRVDRFELEPVLGSESEFSFEATVTGGTYIRGLVRDLGRMLGCGGVLVSLRRTAIAGMRPSANLVLEPEPPAPETLRGELIPLETMPLSLPTVDPIGTEQAAQFCAGMALSIPRARLPDGPCRVLDGGGALLGIAELAGERLQPRVVLAPRRD